MAGATGSFFTQVPEAEPFEKFAEWYELAMKGALAAHRTADDVQATTLCTCTKEGRPSGRTVLLKAFDHQGFVFFTNYESRKGRELAENPFAALVVYWSFLHRQVRIEGRVEKVSDRESDEYFHSRPRGNKLATRASPQSRPVAEGEMEERFRIQEQSFSDSDTIERPSYWGGFRVIPDAIEFWEGSQYRLARRLKYTRRTDSPGWWVCLLAP